jgi:hypothetical protein
MKIPKVSIEIYEDYAIIHGMLSSEILTTLLKLCKKYGFKYLSSFDGGFKLKK